MKRSLKGFCKFLGLGVITIFTTVVIFKHVRPPRDFSSNYYKVRGVNPIPPPPEKLVRLENKYSSHQLENEVKDSLHSENFVKVDWHDYRQIEEDNARRGMFNFNLGSK